MGPRTFASRRRKTGFRAGRTGTGHRPLSEMSHRGGEGFTEDFGVCVGVGPYWSHVPPPAGTPILCSDQNFWSQSETLPRGHMNQENGVVWFLAAAPGPKLLPAQRGFSLLIPPPGPPPLSPDSPPTPPRPVASWPAFGSLEGHHGGSSELTSPLSQSPESSTQPMPVPPQFCPRSPPLRAPPPS